MSQVAYTVSRLETSEWDDLFSESLPANETESPLSLIPAEDAAWKLFAVWLQKLVKTDLGPEGLSTYYATLRAYRDLRRVYYVQPRNQRDEDDLAAKRRFRQRRIFLDKYWGKDHGQWLGRDTCAPFVFGRASEGNTRTGRKKLLTKRTWKPDREMDGVSPRRAGWMRAWQTMWNLWWPHSVAGKWSKKRRNAKQAKRETVKLAKTSWNKTEVGIKSKKKSNSRVAVKKRIAKAAAQQALYDSWNEPTLSEVLADV